MPRDANNSVPAYRLHKRSGQAIVTLTDSSTAQRRDFLLGVYNSPASREKYNRVLGAWMGNGRRLPHESDPDAVTVDELIDRYCTWAESYYRHADGRRTSEVYAIYTALGALRESHASTAAADFGPLALKVVHRTMIGKGWVRDSINKQIGRVRRMFKWAAAEQLIPVFTYQALTTVPDLRTGRTDAIESDPVKPVDEQHVYAAMEYLSHQVRAMIEVQLLTGMRPGEVCQMRPIDLNRDDEVWEYRPVQHKGKHREQDRVIYIGPKAQTILTPYLLRAPDAPMFSPAEAERSRRAEAHAMRSTPLHHGNSPGTNRTQTPGRKPGQRYTVASYRRAIARASDQADAWAKGGMVIGNDDRLIAQWHPHQLRHTTGTRIREEYGLEASQVVLGHRTLDATQIYAERNEKLGKQIMGLVG